jgi:hypothetical protein
VADFLPDWSAAMTSPDVAINRGGQMHLWSVTITDDRDRVVAHGLVRLALLDARPRQGAGVPTHPGEVGP